MNAIESLRKREGTLIFGFVSFLIAAAAMRWSSGDPLFQPSGDIAIVIGAALVALYFVLSDARASKAAPRPGRARELS